MTRLAATKDSEPSWFQRPAVVQVLALLAAVALTAAARAPYWGGPFSIDEYAYVTVGRDVVRGMLPLSGAWLNRGPAGALLYALPTLLPLELDAALDLFALAFAAATAYLIFRLLAARAGAGWGWFGLASFAVLSADPAMQANGANMEIPINFLLMLALVLVFGSQTAVSTRRLFLAGLVIGIAVTLKETSAAFWLVLLVARDPRRGLAAAARGAVATLGGVVLPSLMIWLVYAATGQLELLAAVSSFHAGYVSLHPKWLAAGPLLLLTTNGFALYASWPFAIPASWWLAELPWKWQFPLTARVMVLCAAIAAVAPGHFFAHYYLLFLPPFVLATALWLSCLRERGVDRRVVAALVALLVAWPAALELRMASGRVPTEVRRLAPVATVDGNRKALGRTLAERAAREDRLLVFGGSPTVYAHSGLRPAAPDIWGMTMGSQRANWNWSMSPWLERRTCRAITEQPPEWVVVVDDFRGGDVDRCVARLLHSGYEPVDLGVGPGDGTFQPATAFRRTTTGRG